MAKAKKQSRAERFIDDGDFAMESVSLESEDQAEADKILESLGLKKTSESEKTKDKN